MAAIDSLLKLAQQQGANELRLAVDQPPQMFAYGKPKRLSAPATSAQTLRVLLDTILSPELEQELQVRGSGETNYHAGALGAYRVQFRARDGGGFGVIFTEAGAAPIAAAPPSSELGAPRPRDVSLRPSVVPAAVPAVELRPSSRWPSSKA